jgi:hypothetical protein
VQYGPKYQATFLKYFTQLLPIGSVTSKDMRKGLGTALGGIYALFKLDRNMHEYGDNYNIPKLDMNNEMHREFAYFLNAGGKTGYVELMQAQDVQDRIAKLSKRERAILKKHPAEMAEGLLNFIDILNEGVENATRFAAYLTAREKGKSVTEAVYEAKEVSVNFNMHGSGAWGNALFRKFRNYANVAMQALRKEKVKFQQAPIANLAAWIGQIGLGYLVTMAMYAWAANDDDDENEYAAMSAWNRYNYLNLKTKKGFVHWALPQEQRAMHAVGCIIYEWGNGWITTPQAMHSLAMQMNNFSFLEVVQSTIDKEPDSSFREKVVDAVTVSAAQPFRDISKNEDYLGRPINNKTEYNAYEPEWQRAGRRTPNWAIKVSKMISKATGGEDHKRGRVEINPSDMYYLLSAYGGGTATFIQRMWNLGERIVTGEEHELRDYPFVSKFYVESNNDYSKQRITKDRYDMYKVTFETIDNELKGISKDVKYKKISEEQGRKETERVAGYSDYWIYEIFKGYDSYLNTLFRNMSQSRNSGDMESVKKYSDSINQTQTEIVNQITKRIEETHKKEKE